jgi:hypothetical protein
MQYRNNITSSQENNSEKRYDEDHVMHQFNWIKLSTKINY